MQRRPLSHKGENGSVAVIGGSRTQHGAPLFAALAAEATGVDLVFVCVPSVHAEVAKMTSLNFQVHPFGSQNSDELSARDCSQIIELLATMDAAVIGPGLARTEGNLRSILALLEECPCPVVADASALQPKSLRCLRGKQAVLMPHQGELERMGLRYEEILKHCRETGCTVLLKGPTDTIISPSGDVRKVDGGNAGLTVGGTGDALAGIVAGLIAQKEDPIEACVRASTAIKRAGDLLFSRRGFAYTTRDVIAEIPALLRQS
ncbi:MAG: NAD(P)H-hydrate dehydratase [Candidatus Peribacteraceae bacterium]